MPFALNWRRKGGDCDAGPGFGWTFRLKSRLKSICRRVDPDECQLYLLGGTLADDADGKKTN